ncbi:alpha/beta hydrolase [filamentous cyanobacterium LEGE 11480]|uniref:Alpha/beta hydrolase n=1 Tax=Romeriopsis navalis LEGE 11480 TaxID=2777977 RepID=A0A928VPS5_9CYAN|nr:alpha/beta hydrolase [Romeriopsis navalis]MBE9030370.1 alpha/beta hydrolase [Romeriopsis navalis LEGE 11480]
MQLLQTQAGTIRILDTGGSKQAIILVPDGPCVLEHYREIIQLLEPDFRVIGFDLPGFGFSYPSFKFDFSVSQMGETVIEVMDRLKLPFAALAFTCANGFFAMYAAQHYPDRVSHLVLGQTPSFQAMRQWDRQIIPRVLHIPYVGQLLAAGLVRQLSAKWYDKALPSRSEQKSSFVHQADQALLSGGCFCLASLVQGLNRTEDSSLQNITTPTLMIYGNRDRSHQHTDFTSVSVHVPEAKMIKFDGCGHFPDLEQPQQYIQSIKPFLRA